MTREPIEVTRQDRIYCLKASSDYHRELCEECRFYPNCDHMTQDDMTELTIKDLEALEQEPCEDVVSRTEVLNLVRFNAFHVKSQIKAIENMPSVTPQEPTLDKIRERVERMQKMCDKDDLNWQAQYSAFGMVLDIIDEYKAESEGQQ